MYLKEELQTAAEEIQLKIKSNIEESISIVDKDINYFFEYSLALSMPADFALVMNKLKDALEIGESFERTFSEDVERVWDKYTFGNYKLSQALMLAAMRVPTTEFLADELYYLQKEFESFNYRDDILIATTPKNVILSDIDFGKFAIQLDVNSLGTIGQCGIEVEALEPNYADDDKENPHPHIDSGTYLCTGDAIYSINKAVAEGRILDYFLIVNSILHTYGSSPYIGIQAWTGTSCPNCINHYTGKGFYCEWCDVTYCLDCRSSCTSCEYNVCEGCLPYECEKCYERMCSSCETVCRECDTCICKKCMESCAKCNYHNCGDCIKECPNCKLEICSNCITQCSCESHSCHSCVNECSSCSKPTCINCQQECKSCSEIVCDGCYTDNASLCDECGEVVNESDKKEAQGDS